MPTGKRTGVSPLRGQAASVGSEFEQVRIHQRWRRRETLEFCPMR